jgi:hypothetical protein
MKTPGVKKFRDDKRVEKKHEMAKKMSAHLKEKGRHVVEPKQPKEKDEGDHMESKDGYNRA